ncbi:GNAT family N-acetyltransferase [Paraburkholderia phymatum]|uniref:GCN5-related N-acetyltransferase n=1 Tax=Paraburkholderia phymatum (strain DSM 17167 / CIP 108236 / LMG 21445 / STM815) TaxID=391038 RepID=B2JPL4_PARP8|nr:GNAT family N-acetyltransferase [Paraburkholderia phymatum]ACC73205.1 GCN5-related N-acetyltransferase [Paraburkholderia phymatum STM815]
MNTSTFEIETDRLILRPHVREDFDGSYALWSDETVTRFIGGKPFSREEVWSRLLRYVGHWTLLGYGYWVIREKGSGRYVGEIGFADYQRAMDPPLDAPEIGWVLMPSMHGIGYATEAVRGALAWAEARWPGRDTVCIIAPDNVASRRVAAKCGYIEERQTTYNGHPTGVFRRVG